MKNFCTPAVPLEKEMITKTINDKRQALGRGLDSLLPGRNTGLPAQEISVDLIDPNPYQTRQRMKEDRLAELAESIKANGIIQPVVVRPGMNGRFQLVAGERRWRAAKQAGKMTLPALVKELSNEQALEITIIENLQREDLNPIEQAHAFERLSREFGLTQEQIASRTGKDRTSIANFIRLLRLPVEIQEAIENEHLSLGHGKVLCALIGFPDHLGKVAREVITHKLSVRQTEELVAKVLNPEVNQKPKVPAKVLDANVREAQRHLERALGVKVEIKDRKGKGKIILKYGSLEDFDRILEILAAHHR
jgi:ParB family transcriptional regulator, chromosome partitioning protein